VVTYKSDTLELSLTPQGGVALLTVTIHGDGPPNVQCFRVDGARSLRPLDLSERVNFVDYDRLEYTQDDEGESR
jgi:hypothetical protein